MTEAELIESAGLFYALAISALVFYLSIVSAYLVVAHLVGAKLEKAQVRFITALFVMFALFAVWGSVAFFLIASHFYHESAASKQFLSRQWVPAYVVIGIVEVLGIAASLRFMQAIRSKPDEEAAVADDG